MVLRPSIVSARSMRYRIDCGLVMPCRSALRTSLRLGSVAAAVMLLLPAMIGCGGGSSNASPRPSRSVVIGHGRTAAGWAFVATVQPAPGGETTRTGACPLNILITESAQSQTTMVCYSWSESPVRPRVECHTGTLIIRLRVRDNTRNVRLALSDGRTVTSPVMLVPRGFGGPATLYYQAVQGPKPVPVSITELDERGRVVKTLATPRVGECTKVLVRHLPGSAHILAKDRAPDGKSLTISSERTRILGKTYFGLRVAFAGPGAAVIGSGPLRLALPLEWDVKRVCKPYAYSIIYGVLASPSDEVFVRTGIALQSMRRVPISASVRPDSVLVYDLVRQIPTELIARTREGKIIVDKNVSSIFAETPCM